LAQGAETQAHVATTHRRHFTGLRRHTCGRKQWLGNMLPFSLHSSSVLRFS